MNVAVVELRNRPTTKPEHRLEVDLDGKLSYDKMTEVMDAIFTLEGVTGVAYFNEEKEDHNGSS